MKAVVSNLNLLLKVVEKGVMKIIKQLWKRQKSQVEVWWLRDFKKVPTKSFETRGNNFVIKEVVSWDFQKILWDSPVWLNPDILSVV